jgi:hypothetical protein
VDLQEPGPREAQQLAGLLARHPHCHTVHFPSSDETKQYRIRVFGMALGLSCCPAIKSFTLYSYLRADAAEALAAGLQAGGLPNLHELELPEVRFERGAVVPLLQALAAGACPLLRSLCINLWSWQEPDVQSLAMILEARRELGLPDLTKLTIEDDKGAELQAILTVAGRALTGLESFSIKTWLREPDPPAMDALGVFLDRTTQLRELCLSLNDSDPSLRPITQSLARGAAPGLRSLYLDLAWREEATTLALSSLGEAFEAGALLQLEDVELYDPWLTGAAMCHLIDGVMRSKHRGPAMKKISFIYPNYEDASKGPEDAGLAMLAGLRMGAFPRLEEVYVEYTNPGGEEETTDVFPPGELERALEDGARPFAATLGKLPRYMMSTVMFRVR